MRIKYNGPEEFFPKKYLTENILTDGLTLREVQSQYHEFFYRKDYDWWRGVKPGDIVVDMGACVGFFTLNALDRGAKIVHAVEPSKKNLKTLLSNLADYWIDNKQIPVIPYNTMIGDPELKHSLYLGNHVYSDETDLEITDFETFMGENNIFHVNFLKIDIEGCEYNIFKEKNINYLKHQVDHIAVEFHLNSSLEAPYEWLRVRELIYSNWEEKQINLLDENSLRAFNEPEEKFIREWPVQDLPGCFMVYITNR